MKRRKPWRGQKFRLTSSARSSVDNVLTVLKKFFRVDPDQYEIHLNFPGGIPVDGPSAGITVAVAIYSAIHNVPVDLEMAMTGELSILGKVKPVGGMAAKVEAARLAGIKRVLIPADNYQELFEELTDIEVMPVGHIEQVFEIVFRQTYGAGAAAI